MVGKILLIIFFTPLLILKPQELKEISFALHWLPQAQFAGYYAAEHYGIYKKHGLNVEIIHTGPNITSQELLDKGNADAASMFLTTALTEKFRGINLINIGQLSQKCAQLFVAKKSSGVNNPEDINGKKIGIWKSGFHEVPSAFIIHYDLDVEMIPIASSVTLFMLDGIELFTAMWYNEYHTIINSGLDENQLTTFFFSDYDLDIPEDGIYCIKNRYDSEPELFQSFVKATLEGWHLAFNNRNEILDIVLSEMNKANIPANRAHQAWMLTIMKNIFTNNKGELLSGILSEEKFNKAVSTLIETNKITTRPSFNNFYFGK